MLASRLRRASVIGEDVLRLGLVKRRAPSAGCGRPSSFCELFEVGVGRRQIDINRDQLIAALAGCR
jgi:hypothetical protein